MVIIASTLFAKMDLELYFVLDIKMEICFISDQSPYNVSTQSVYSSQKEHETQEPLLPSLVMILRSTIVCWFGMMT